ncbi:MAG: hypothetical protein IJ948_00650, partial [Clostridia bacterium]|nr:hypothetical protein [Clostridia bacterium]
MNKITLSFCEDSPKRMDTFVSVSAEVSRSRACELLDGGYVLVNGVKASKKTKLKRSKSRLRQGHRCCQGTGHQAGCSGRRRGCLRRADQARGQDREAA